VFILFWLPFWVDFIVLSIMRTLNVQKQRHFWKKHEKNRKKSKMPKKASGKIKQMPSTPQIPIFNRFNVTCKNRVKSLQERFGCITWFCERFYTEVCKYKNSLFAACDDLRKNYLRPIVKFLLLIFYVVSIFDSFKERTARNLTF